MTGKQPNITQDDRGVAGIEFVFAAPLLLLMLGGLSDFGLASWKKAILASSVSEGASYAILAAPATLSTPTVNIPAIQNIVGEKLSLPASSVTVTGPTCFCVSGAPAVKTPQACSTSCPDEKKPGTYVTITARHTYQPIFPVYEKFASTLLVETAMARLK